MCKSRKVMWGKRNIDVKIGIEKAIVSMVASMQIIVIYKVTFLPERKGVLSK